MKANKSLTATLSAIALVAGAGFAYAQVSPPATEPTTPGTSTMQSQPAADPSTTQTQSQPSTSSGSSVDSSTSASPAPADTTTLEPRADRN
jgi:hypothetical protein